MSGQSASQAAWIAATNAQRSGSYHEDRKASLRDMACGGDPGRVTVESLLAASRPELAPEAVLSRLKGRAQRLASIEVQRKEQQTRREAAIAGAKRKGGGDAGTGLVAPSRAVQTECKLPSELMEDVGKDG